MFDLNEVASITRHLVIALGLEIQPNTNILIDQETKNQLMFDGKFLKANTDPKKALYLSDTDVKLDPLDPRSTKMIERLFGKFLINESSEELQNIPEVLTYFFDRNEVDGKFTLTIKFADGSRWVGTPYYNKVFCYDEAIFYIDGAFCIDLHRYDLSPEEFKNIQC